MFGFKKTIPINEFGLAVLRYADDFISADAGRSLGTQFENWDGSRGWWTFLQERGMSTSSMKLYRRLYTHCVLQATFKGFSPSHRWEMVHGAMDAFVDTLPDYSLGKVFSELEAVFAGNFELNPRVDGLDSDSRLSFSAYPRVGILASKYLINTFIIPNMYNGNTFVDNFNLFCGTVGSSVATANRAMDQITTKVKIGPQSSPPPMPAPWVRGSQVGTVKDVPTKSNRIDNPISPFAWVKIPESPADPSPSVKSKYDFEIGELIHYRAIGLGRIVDLEKFEGSDGEIERFVIEFEEDEAVFRVPTSRLYEMMLRKPPVLGNDDFDEDDEAPILECNGFKVDEYVVYPQHGVGKIIAIEWQEIAGARLKLFVINFKNGNMTLRVPTEKYKNVGLRRLADEI